MERELVFNGTIYMNMLEGETEEEADERMYKILEDTGLCVGDYTVEARDM